mgnify:CR=1 FL=1
MGVPAKSRCSGAASHRDHWTDRATRPLSKLDVRQYVRDLRDGTWRPQEMAWFFWSAFAYRVRAVLTGLRSAGIRGSGTRTASEVLVFVAATS